MVDTVMYGDAIKVDFYFKGGDTPTKNVILPANSFWFDVYNNKIVTPEPGTSTVSMTAEMNHPIVL